ncbi:MAG: hypothetical protein K8F60_14435, partial [Melioribacteraceae bacterium]|nr:hypothetical protein [Melioribacteraceae bacterium]
MRHIQIFGTPYKHMVFWKNNAWDKRIPHPNEINVQVMLALAHGAKGIFYYNLFSYSNNNETHDGLLDFNYNPTTRYTKIKDEITPRLKGALGDKLLKLNYTGEYLQTKKLNGTLINHDNIDFIDVEDADDATTYNYHVGVFENLNGADDKYFMIINLLCGETESKTVRCSLFAPNYANVVVINIGKNYEETFIMNEGIGFTNTIPPGEGYLYQVVPVIRYGGELLTDETISTANNTLKGTLRIPTSIELTINKPYVIKEDIFIETEGKLTVGVGGELILDGGKVRGERWEDIFYINQNQTHPKLLWSVNREYSNPIRYNIWRKKNTQSYEKIVVINDKNITEYTDTDTEIILGEEQANQITA